MVEYWAHNPDDAGSTPALATMNIKGNVRKAFTYLRSNPLFVHGFDNREDVFREFQREDDPDIEFIYAYYSQGGYDGTAVVFYSRKSTGELYQAYGSHCSCYGLEGQWGGDEKLTIEELAHRISGDNDLDDEGYFKGYAMACSKGI